MIKGSSLCVGDLFIKAITILSKLLFNCNNLRASVSMYHFIVIRKLSKIF